MMQEIERAWVRSAGHPRVACFNQDGKAQVNEARVVKSKCEQITCMADRGIWNGVR